jgi:hypothetical protein
VAQPVHPPLGRRGRQPDPLAEGGKALTTVFAQRRKNLVIDIVKSQRSTLTFVRLTFVIACPAA